MFINVDFRKTRTAGCKINIFRVIHITNIATSHRRILVAEEVVSYSPAASALQKKTLS
jgi:hypothetical protein